MVVDVNMFNVHNAWNRRSLQQRSFRPAPCLSVRRTPVEGCHMVSSNVHYSTMPLRKEDVPRPCRLNLSAIV